ncbi:MAG: helix-turn-helix domain-containing protein [Bacteroidales bacterium]
MNTTTHLDAISAFIFIGVFQGLILSFFFIIKSSSNIKANLYQGLLLLSLTLCILEQFLNLTGYITKVLVITNYSEPLNLTIGPLLYLFIKRSLDQSNSKKDWIHFIIAFLYLCYLTFDLIQPNEMKYNSYVYSFHPDWPTIKFHYFVSNDPLQLKKWLNLATGIQLVIYISFAFRLLMKKGHQEGESILTTKDEVLRPLRNMVFHITIVLLIFIIVKLCFKGDLGDYYIGAYVSVIILITTFRIMNDSDYFDRSTAFMDLSMSKYRKSSLTEAAKLKILDNIIFELETKKYFLDNLASLSELAKKLGESPHHVSQVINEKLNESFFELLASYRVEEAKRILSGDKSNKLTVEEISEMVGYNSKTAFNNAFKKLTRKTPSDFKKSINS